MIQEIVSGPEQYGGHTNRYSGETANESGDLGTCAVLPNGFYLHGTSDRNGAISHHRGVESLDRGARVRSANGTVDLGICADLFDLPDVASGIYLHWPSDWSDEVSDHRGVEAPGRDVRLRREQEEL
ncbi:hypothetical protein N7532_012027 [Penicillium argentinense]|uniref:Uncharacterized protein n=1 Tax=Penicillium argentinense TaxID=1131581 RepID=A0A9W9EJJ9_9EURO|nr:uncharacterized protein N7532_012027 [Penicillium argentinense]KAJ5082984.1 hypothetical protein N7532_012027 [Penicillium argentinense]